MSGLNPLADWNIGTIGFGYDDWRGVFYPNGMKAASYLAHYSLIFNTVEIDSTFHALPRVENLLRWAQMTPDSFRFCLKMPKEITHRPDLGGAGPTLAEFTHLVRTLGDKLAVILIQFPPTFRVASLPALEVFCSSLPADLKYAVEVRHQTWYTSGSGEAEPPLAGVLRRFGIGWAATDYPRTPGRIYKTCDFLYLRWIGQNGAFLHHATERLDRSADLVFWKGLLEPVLSDFSTIYGFFNNDYAGFAPGTANRFKTLMGLQTSQFEPPQQGRLF